MNHFIILILLFQEKFHRLYRAWNLRLGYMKSATLGWQHRLITPVCTFPTLILVHTQVRVNGMVICPKVWPNSVTFLVLFLLCFDQSPSEAPVMRCLHATDPGKEVLSIGCITDIEVAFLWGISMFQWFIKLLKDLSPDRCGFLAFESCLKACM